MIVIFLLIPLSIATATIFLAAFIWAVRSGQYEDTCTPSLRLLAEDSDTIKSEAPALAATQPAAAVKPPGTPAEQITRRE